MIVSNEYKDSEKHAAASKNLRLTLDKTKFIIKLYIYSFVHSFIHSLMHGIVDSPSMPTNIALRVRDTHEINLCQKLESFEFILPLAEYRSINRRVHRIISITAGGTDM